MNITQKELTKMDKNPLLELRKRFNAILKEYNSEGNNTIKPDRVCWNNSHTLKGILSTKNYTMTIEISKRI